MNRFAYLLLHIVNEVEVVDSQSAKREHHGSFRAGFHEQ